MKDSGGATSQHENKTKEPLHSAMQVWILQQSGMRFGLQWSSIPVRSPKKTAIIYLVLSPNMAQQSAAKAIKPNA